MAFFYQDLSVKFIYDKKEGQETIFPIRVINRKTGSIDSFQNQTFPNMTEAIKQIYSIFDDDKNN